MWLLVSIFFCILADFSTSVPMRGLCFRWAFGLMNEKGGLDDDAQGYPKQTQKHRRPTGGESAFMHDTIHYILSLFYAFPLILIYWQFSMPSLI